MRSKRNGSSSIDRLPGYACCCLARGWTNQPAFRAASQKIEQCSLLISQIVLLELEYLFERNRFSRPSLQAAEILKADLDVRICNFAFPPVVQAAVHEKWTRDAFDRIIVAHARANGIATLISADEQVQTNYHATIW